MCLEHHQINCTKKASITEKSILDSSKIFGKIRWLGAAPVYVLTQWDWT